MGFDTTGYVLKSARSAPSNATTTAGATSGVSRQHADLPGSYTLPGDLVEVSADQYRASVLDNPSEGTQEYLLWAANTSNLAILEDPSWAIDQGSGAFPVGTLTVGAFTDGTDHVVVTDDANRSIASILSITVTRGDLPAAPVPIVAGLFASQDADAGIVVLGAAALTALGGGLSTARGDRITVVSYYLAAQRFWWTRNDPYLERFGWNGITQRWEPFKGGTPVSLGTILANGRYTLLPRPSRFVVGDTLPGAPLVPDAYAMVRVGDRPDASSVPTNVLVVTDVEAAAPYVFPIGVDAVVGSSSGTLQWNPAFVTLNAGRVAWYVHEAFVQGSSGILGDLAAAGDEPLFICPIPGPTDNPLVRIGSRRHLRALPADTDAALAVLTVGVGEVGWSLATGKLKFNASDVAKADPDAVGFELLYLGAKVVYDGVSLTRVSVGTRVPRQVVDSSGMPTTVDGSKNLFVPNTIPLPSPGSSGISLVPDGTGLVPNTSATPSTRPNGSGLVRKVLGVGDTFFFGKPGAIETTEVVEFNNELPNFPFSIREGLAVVATELDASLAGSRVEIGRKDRRTFDGEPLYLLQADVQPSVFASQARLVSRVQEPFVLAGTEVLAFAVDGTNYLWSASLLGAGSYTAAAVAASIDTVITGSGAATALLGRVVLSAGSLTTGSVEVGFGSTVSGAYADRDLSGCTTLGLPPGWRVDDPSTNDNWLSDSGISYGVRRSPQNLNRSREVPDACSRARFRDAVLSEGVSPSPVFQVNNPPLLDVAGYDEGVFFRIVDGLYLRDLDPYQDVLYQFESRRFSWLEVGTLSAAVTSPVDSLSLGSGTVGLTLHPAVGAGQGLYVGAAGTLPLLQVLGTDYLLSDASGQATLIERVGARVASGARGTFAAASVAFTDPDATFVTDGVVPGYRLKLSGTPVEAAGSYIVAAVGGETTLTVESDVPFPAVGTTVSWELFEGFPDTVYDPGLLADVAYEDFNHLPDEPFQVRVLSVLGPTPPDASAQALSRLQAVVADALAEGRDISVRFGQAAGSPGASLTALTRTQLGTVVNGSLAVPDVSDPHFVEATFSIRVGDQAYTIGTDLTGVVAFTVPLSGDQVEYGLPLSGVEGQLNFGEDTLAEMAGSLVDYVQEFSDPADLAAGEAEVDPLTGNLNLSAPDMASYGGDPAYFVERMITEARLDVVISPLNGAVLFNRPLRALQLVEVSYFSADVSGAKVLPEITEFLPLTVRREAATPNTAYEWAFNPSGRTVRGDVAAQVWVNNRLQNYGNTVQCVVDAAASLIRFTLPVDVGATVLITYGVNETTGGETAFTVSTPPVYRPPFFLVAGQDSFTLDTNRVADMVPGKLLRIGAQPFYIKSAAYAPIEDETAVTVFPTPEIEAGSRTPGNDVLTLISSVPVTISVDGNPTTGAAGFLLTLTADYEPVDKGMLSIVFRGDVTAFAVAGHLLEIAGYPVLIAGSTLSPDGRTTRIDLTSPLLRGFDPTVDAVKVSARPVYPPGARTLLGLGPVVATEPVEVVLFGETDPLGTPLPGRTLQRGGEYNISESDGTVSLLAPLQESFGPDMRLTVSFTERRTLGPFVKDGSVVLPLYRVSGARIVLPTEANGFLDAFLVGTYTFSSPDSFYVRTVPMVDYMGEVARIATTRLAGQVPGGGPMVATAPSQENWDYGTVPLLSQERELQDQDRAARVFISLYDEFVRDFEQVLETINGEVVGDRDGRFRFFIGRNRVYGGPGYEDEITGLLESRFVWSEVFLAANGSFGVTETDPVVNPESASQDPLTLEVSGDPLNPWLLDFYIREQRRYVLNDIDDTVLVGKRTRLRFLFDFVQEGEFAQMWEPSVISRVYPESALAFTTTYPGLLAGTLPGEPGVYAYRRQIERPRLMKGEGPVIGSTYGMDIGSIENPALGRIENVTGQTRVRERLPRARVWAYSPTGFPDLDPATAGLPSIIATPLPLKDFPLDPDTGLPDITRLAANGGDLPDLSTGDPDLSTPAWEVYEDSDARDARPQMQLGRPSGETYAIGYAASTISSAFSGAFNFNPIYKGIFVGSVRQGCILTFTSGDGNEISDSDDIIRIAEDGVGTLPFEPVRGDTVYVIPPSSEDASTFANPPSVKDLRKFARNQPTLDVGVRERSGTFVDRSLPSIEDPAFPIKEITNQKTASPLQAIEADVEFPNVMREPFQFPALLGEPTNDSGDYTVPYLATTNTELDRLGSVQASFTSVVQTDSPLPNAVYPDEVLGDDGTILATASGSIPPATLLTSQDLTPVATAGVYTPHSGIGDVRRYDLLLVEKNQATVANGIEGILSVGSVATNRVEPPRFVTRTLQGTRIRYLFANAMVHLTTTFTSGVVVTEVAGTTTTFDITSVGGLFLNNGAVGLVGGLNNIVSNGLFPYPNGNRITIDIISSSTGLVLETVTLAGGLATGGLGAVAMGAVPTFSQKVLTVTAVGFVNFASLGGAAPGPVGPFDFRVTVDTFVAIGTPLTGSNTAFVDDDRLTFIEAMDLRSVRPRGAVTIGGVSVQGELSVHRVTASGTVTCIVNAPLFVNGGSAFTFLARDSALPLAIGTFDPSPGTGNGAVKVMGFEGHGNVALPSTGDFTFSAIPSSDRDAAGLILSGTGSVSDTGTGLINPNSIRSVSVATGALDSVVSGDIVVVPTSSVGDATVKAGTYLVRHAIEDAPAASGYRETFTSTLGGTSGGWVKLPLPKVTAATLGPFEVTISFVQTVASSPSGYDWAASGRLYVLPSATDLTVAVSTAYTAFVVNLDGTATFTLTAGSARNATGGVITDAAFVAAAAVGTTASGMVFLPVGRFPTPLPSNNVVGHGHGITTVGGFVDVTVDAAGSVTFAFGGTLADASTVSPPVDSLGVAVSIPATTDDSTSFVVDPTTPVFLDVSMHLDLRGLADVTSTVFTTIHGASANAVRCVAPGDDFLTHNGTFTVGTGFRAAAGLFLEPSFPRPTRDLGDGEIKVVDAGNSAAGIDRIGMRSAAAFGIATPELVSFTVCRIRRFHDVLDGIGDNLAPLRFAYEIRRGTVASYAASTFTFVATSTGTQLGGFDEEDVNVNPGDVVRILDVNGDVVDEAEVAVVTNGTTLVLRSPGLAENPPVGGESFQVYLRQAPVPHEQSNEQLLGLITDQVVFESTADPVTGDGGRADAPNVLKDPSVANFTTLGILPGDIVLVDPAGGLEGATGPAVPPESGVRPFGDQSVASRLDGSHVAGGPSQLDDNRGWYRVTSVAASTLGVSGTTEFTGPNGSPVIFGASSPTNQQFAVVPDITGSGLTGTTEGQMALRPTKPAGFSSLDPNSYLGNFYSVEPFTYRILRPTQLVSDETVDLILLMRERMLSLMEEMATALEGRKQGSYYVFQRDEQVGDLGSPTDASAGSGVPSNLFVTGLSGLTQYAPFANTSDCLSVLDRRYWCLDLRLDYEVPPYNGAGNPYSSFEVDTSSSGYTVGSGRPAEPDLIEEVLDRSDRLRALRYSWIKFRANRVTGTLPAIERFIADLPRLLREQEDFLRLQQSLSEV